MLFSRRSVLTSAAAAAAALGLSKPLIFAGPAFAAMPIEPVVGHYKYKVGSIEVAAVYDGIWRKPHDPAFIKSVYRGDQGRPGEGWYDHGLYSDPADGRRAEDRRQAGHDRLGSGGPVAADRRQLPDNLKAAGIDPTKSAPS